MKRRASLRSKREPSPSRNENKENAGTNRDCAVSPGPTPYWKVSEIINVVKSNRLPNCAH